MKNIEIILGSAVGDLHSKILGVHPLLSLIFQILPNNRLMPPFGVGAPRLGNPGSVARVVAEQDRKNGSPNTKDHLKLLASYF